MGLVGSDRISGENFTETLSEAGEKSLSALLVGKTIGDMGLLVFQGILESIPLRSQSTGSEKGSRLFPLPNSRPTLLNAFPNLGEECLAWLLALVIALNSFYGCEIFSDKPINEVQKRCLDLLVEDVQRVCSLGHRLEHFDWGDFFSTRSIDYKGDEVKTARQLTWANISPALPKEIGRVPLAEVCALGARHYVEHFDLFIRPPETWSLKRPPKVMVPDQAWGEVCTGLVQSGVCTFLAAEDVFQTGSGPLLNGMFGVTKDEWHDGVEVYRLIMNMIPLNSIPQTLKGDVETLPMWSLMSPFFIQPNESLLISSEDVRCFFYTMSVPKCWQKYLAFNKLVPQDVLPPELQGRDVYLTSQVLPMGFLNSVSLAQHVRRNLALWSGEDYDGPVNAPECEIRKDRASTIGNPSWRIYLDNYDLLERVKALDVSSLSGSVAPAALALRQQYEKWEVPRNLKKAVARSDLAEIQGAQVDGQRGIAYPREVKLCKYLAATLSLLEASAVTQRQVQVVTGGLVYVSMFRRPMLGSLNSLWQFIQAFTNPLQRRSLPGPVRHELLRFLGMLPLAKLDFRLDYQEQVTCSDASTSGGGICVSTKLSSLGSMAASGKLRGELPELRSDHKVLSIGLFDGIGSLRVGLDLLGVNVIGHVSVEKDEAARRVVESHFPETLSVERVEDVDEPMVASWAVEFSQASVVVLGGGPPCQGVSGLNASRKGALRTCAESGTCFGHTSCGARSMPLWKVLRPWMLLTEMLCQRALGHSLGLAMPVISLGVTGLGSTG